MKSSIPLICVCTAMAFALSSCRENPLDWLNDGHQSSGTVSGNIILQQGDMPSAPIRFPADSYGGVCVKFEGTNLSTTTAPDGSWEISGVPKGVYDVTFEKDGFGPLTLVSWQFVGTGEAQMETQYLCSISRAELGNIDIRHTASSETVRMVVEQAPSSRVGSSYYVVFFGDGPDVSHRPGTYKHYIYQAWTYLSIEPFYEFGDDVYVVAYPVSECDLHFPIDGTGKDPADYQDYFDLLEGQRSDVVHFVY